MFPEKPGGIRKDQMKQSRQGKDHATVGAGQFHDEEKQDFCTKNQEYLFDRLAEFNEIASVHDIVHRVQQHRGRSDPPDPAPPPLPPREHGAGGQEMKRPTEHSHPQSSGRMTN